MPDDSPPTVEPFRRVSIRGLLNQGDFELEFGNGNVPLAQDGELARFSTDGSDFDSLRIVYGLNGSGKTSALSIVNSLLSGRIHDLLSIPFHSIEVERWEPWGGDAERIPGGIDGMQIGTTDSGDGTFSDNYNYLKFVTKEYTDWMKSQNSYSQAGHITEEQKRIIEEYLENDEGMREEVSGISESGAFEIYMCNAHSHTLSIERKEEDGRVWFEAEYRQDRSVNKSYRANWRNQSLVDLLSLLGVEERAIVALEGKETIAKDVASISSAGENARFRSYLVENGVIPSDFPGQPGLDILGSMDASQIRELHEMGIVDTMGIWKVWKAFNGDRRFWGEESEIARFETEYSELNDGEKISVDWDRSTTVTTNTVTLIGPNAETNNREFISSEVGRIQDLMHKSRMGSNLLKGMENEEQMLGTLRSAFSGEYGSDEVSKLSLRLNVFSIICDNLAPSADEALGHLSSLPSILEDLNEEFPDSIASREMKQWGDLIPGEIVFRRLFPFLREMNEDFLINKSIRITGNLGLQVVTDSGDIIPFSRLSHGELRLLYMLSLISFRPTSGARWPTILIDEPEVGLHIEWQRKLVSAIKAFYRIGDSGGSENWGNPVKVVIATHSPEIVASSPEDAISIEPMFEEFR